MQIVFSITTPFSQTASLLKNFNFLLSACARVKIVCTRPEIALTGWWKKNTPGSQFLLPMKNSVVYNRWSVARVSRWILKTNALARFNPRSNTYFLIKSRRRLFCCLANNAFMTRMRLRLATITLSSSILRTRFTCRYFYKLRDSCNSIFTTFHTRNKIN